MSYITPFSLQRHIQSSLDRATNQAHSNSSPNPPLSVLDKRTRDVATPCLIGPSPEPPLLPLILEYTFEEWTVEAQPHRLVRIAQARDKFLWQQIEEERLHKRLRSYWAHLQEEFHQLLQQIKEKQ